MKVYVCPGHIRIADEVLSRRLRDMASQLEMFGTAFAHERREGREAEDDGLPF